MLACPPSETVPDAPELRALPTPPTDVEPELVDCEPDIEPDVLVPTAVEPAPPLDDIELEPAAREPLLNWRLDAAR
jgi:hypothetical protein